jgi:ABC-type multidrug transport system ATPase subunit
MSVLVANNIMKSYGDSLALNGVSLSISDNMVFGLLGANGAGKTTFIKIVLDLVKADEGTVSLCGHDSTDSQARLSIAYMPEKFSFFTYYTVRGVLDFYGKMRNLSKAERLSQIDFALKKFSINGIADKKINTLSKGQLQRTGLASTLIGDQQVYILDEPFSGLDPIGIKDVKDLILDLKASGKTVFINSHILSEMEKICDTVGIIDRGELLYNGSVTDITKKETLESFFYKKVKKQ